MTIDSIWIRIAIALIWLSLPFLSVGIPFVMLIRAAYSHDREHPENDKCLADLENKSGQKCCDGTDAERVDNAEWDAKRGHYVVFLEGEWVEVPDNALIAGGKGCPGPTRVWTGHLNGHPYPRCFAPGAGG
jgi:hypothetical protein